MTDYAAIKEDPFLNLDYFTQWGARPWIKFVEIGIGNYLGKDLGGKKVLEIGPGRGRITSLLAILGGEVTALEISEERIEQIKTETTNFGVSEQVECLKYNGDLREIGERKFDIIFSKSALIYPDNLEEYLKGLDSLLAEGGKIVFIENALGSRLLHILRWLKRRSPSFFKRTHYFTKKEVELVKSIFKVELMMHSKVPPIYLFCGKKR